MTVAKSGIKHIKDDVERCLSLVRCHFFCELLAYNLFSLFFLFFLMYLRIQCVEERMRVLLSKIIRTSKQVSLLSSPALLCQDVCEV